MFSMRPSDDALLTAKPEHILTFVVEVTDRCNLRCVYCHQNLPDFRPQRDINDESFEALVQYAREHKVGMIDLTGAGDLMMHPTWREKCAQLLSAGFQISILLNLGAILSDADAMLVARFHTVTVSIDTMDREILKRVRKSVDVRTIVYNMMRIKACALKQNLKGPKWGASVVFYAESALRLPELV